MRMFNDCGSCGDECPKRHQPICGGDFINIVTDPFDDSFWNVTVNGNLFRLKVPAGHETDTTLSVNYSNPSLIYTAEEHTDTITGEQVGDIIRVEDLRDVKADYTTDSMCYELIYHKYGECGEGCQSVENSWATFSIDNENALVDAMRYVRGANAFGCPIFLDAPAKPNEWYYAGWRTDGATNQFGYYQAEEVSTLPRDGNGDIIVLSQKPDGKPVVGKLPLDCIISNIMGNLGVDISSKWSVIQETPQFGATFNNITGEFKIKWTDWNDNVAHPTQRAGYGQIDGQLVWTNHFDSKTGNQIFEITGLNFYNIKWTKDLGVTASTKPSLTLKGMPLPDGALVDVYTSGPYGDTSWSQKLSVSIPCTQTVTLEPGQTLGPFNFAYLHVDWVVDDEGYLGAVFTNRVSGWANCLEY